MPTPKEILGFQPTDDRTIADWKQISGYFAKLDAASDRVKVEEIGKTTLGKSQIVAYISSAENIKNLDFYKTLNQKNYDPRLPREISLPTGNTVGKPKSIVAISCSIHSTEIVASQMSMNLAYELATATDEKTKNILENTILLLIPSANPDGIDIVADWYRKTLGTKYEGSTPPELYHHYAGHDNNRDWFMLNLQETRNITKLFWQEWFPQIVYDVHQQGQTGARMTLPPFFDPPNPRISPVILRELGLLGYKMAADLQREGQKGVTTNATYDTWWHGGFRSAPYYHNSIGILSEAASAALMTPVTIKKEDMMRRNPTRGIVSMLETATNIPDPWEGGTWGPKDIARIEMISSYAVLEMAAKFRERYLENARMLAAKNLEIDKNEPRAFLVYPGQPNEERVARFLEILMWQGVEVHELTEELFAKMTLEEKEFHEVPAGSFIVFVNQVQKPNVLSLFEKQVYPERINANGEAEVPYDVSGWTLPVQMGVEFTSIQEIRDFEKARDTLKKVETVNQARKRLNLKPNAQPFAKLPNPLKTNPKIGMYKGWANSMDEGWTRLVLDNHGIRYTSLMDEDFRAGKLNYDAIILPSISERYLVEGLNEKDYPKEFTGGLTEKGVENLKKFVSKGGKLICFDDSCEMVINKFGLPMKNALKDLNRKQFYSPGTILEIDVDTMNPLARGFNKKTPAYFINSSAFEIADVSKIKSVAKYGAQDILLSGWIFGEKYLNGKTAIAETEYGRGRIILFAFRPQHRGQTFGTFPFIFNALEKN